MITISDDLGLCLHPDQRAEIVTVARQAGPRYEHTSGSPVRGMLRRRRPAPPAQPFHRVTCPDCGAWAVGLYWPPVIGPTLVNTADGGYAGPRTPGEKELT